MDDIIEFLIELFGEILAEVLANIKNPRKRRWALTMFYSVFWLGITAVLAYFAVDLGKENNTVGTVVLGVLAGIVFLVFGYFIVRGHRQNWKRH